MRIKEHAKSYIVELADGSAWRIWPADIGITLQWTPSSRIVVAAINDPFCTHALIDRNTGTRVRVIEAISEWSPEDIDASLIDESR